MDPLSSVLALLKPRNYLSAGLDAGGDWSIQFPDQQQCIKTGAVVSGQCWMSLEGSEKPIFLQAGDCFLLPHARPFRLASDLALPPTDAVSVFSAPRNGNIAVHNGGGDFLLASNRFGLAGNHASILLRALPPFIHVRDQIGQASLRFAIERMMQELTDPQPGSVLVIDHLAHMMLVQALRLHLADSAGTGIGWLAGLADRQVSKAINAIHGDPAHRWSLRELAAAAGMSRSSFAEKFRQTVGAPAMEYTAQWRMLLAADRLQNGREPISVIAPSLGYESEAAFSTAFKKIMGSSPRQYAHNQPPVFAVPPMPGNVAPKHNEGLINAA
ncbi:AraC family transcriptional regulator [Neorhizobium lilium]|uniref:AraC family transcriptional regulator n=1 Tax=Neorhizobium lilium TaxID=2503024 RepID=A0A444LJK0_9HYPH|nr:AraC family transcriptional regulator [Neorhizobium lilium]RWX79135.1 AraC family transcriptional regulator [Neorhizobium lilium]